MKKSILKASRLSIGILLSVILDTFKALKMSYPETSTQHQQELLSIRHQLMDEGNSSD
jgi:predicted DNA-binding protein with PD1-like motif